MGAFFVRCFLMGLPLTVLPVVELLSKRTFSSAREREFMLVMLCRGGGLERKGKKKKKLRSNGSRWKRRNIRHDTNEDLLESELLGCLETVLIFSFLNHPIVALSWKSRINDIYDTI